MSNSQRIAEHFGAELVNLANVNFTPELLACIPAKLAFKYRVLPVAKSEHHLVIAISDPSDLKTLDALHSALNTKIELRVAEKSQLDSFIQRFFEDDNSPQ